MHRLFKRCRISDSSWLTLIIALALLFPAAVNAEPGIETQIRTHLAESREAVRAMRTGLREGRDLTPAVDRLKAHAQQLQERQAAFAAWLATHQEKISGMGPEARARYAAMLERARERLTACLGAIERLAAAPAQATGDDLDRLERLLDAAIGPKASPVYGAMPYRHLNYARLAPEYTPEITPAYRGGDPEVTPADLAGAPEAPLTPEIAALAERLNWSPVAIYAWVKNHVATEWYWGCMKGAAETLRQESGNDSDQAALLVALLRAAGYPARYVRGVMEFYPDLEIAGSVTGLTDPAEMAQLFRKAGIPCQPVFKGGAIHNIQLAHVWVETRVPYANYRGAVMDGTGATWLALDTSIKNSGVETHAPADGLEALDLSTLAADYLTGIQAEDPMGFLRTRIQAALDQAGTGTAYADLLQTRTLTPEPLNFLPASLQYRQVAVTGEYRALPADLVHTVAITARDERGNALFTARGPVHDYTNRQISLWYEPETVADQEIIRSFGGFANTPPYLVRLRPVLKKETTRIAIGTGGLPVGEALSLSVGLHGPHGGETIENTLETGSLCVIGLASQQAGAPQIEPEAGRDAARLFYEAAMGYMDQWHRAEEELGALLRIHPVRPVPAVVSVGGVFAVDRLFGDAFTFDLKGAYLDADLRRIELAGGGPLAGGADPHPLFMSLSGLQGSVLEAEALAEGFAVGSVCTAHVLGRARETGVAIHTLNKETLDTHLPGLPYSQEILDAVTDAVNRNLEVRIPAAGVAVEDWTGAGYVTENPETGESGWMLSGRIAGGMTAWRLDRWEDYYRTRLQNMFEFTGEANDNPAAAAAVKKISATDMQHGAAGSPLATPLRVMVQDAFHRPVKGAAVTFTVRAGGGAFTGGGAAYEAVTDGRGLAEAPFVLGQKTGDNPAFLWEDNAPHPQQVGENIIDARLSTGIGISVPFTAYGFPGPAASIDAATLGGSGKILTWLGRIRATVRDAYGNPRSNETLTFAAHPPTGGDTCPKPAGDTRETLLFSADDPCLAGFPVYGDCASAGPELAVETDVEGARVQVMAGAVPGETTVAITSGELGTSVSILATVLGNCDGHSAPWHDFSLAVKDTVDANGVAITAAPPGGTLPVRGRITFIREREEEIQRTYTCGNGSATCTAIVGARAYDVETDFTRAEMDFGGQTGTHVGDGIFEIDYVVRPGVNAITITATGEVDIRKDYNTCDGCRIETETLTRTGTVEKTVYGVEITAPERVVVAVDGQGRAVCDVPIHYTILPAEYRAAGGYVALYEDGAPVAYLPGETSGDGVVTLARGMAFTGGKSYCAEVILNGGGAAEIRSEKIPLLLEENPLKSIYLVDGESVPAILPGDTVLIAAETEPAGQPVTWTGAALDEGVSVVLESASAATCRLTAQMESGDGWYLVTGTHADNPCLRKKALVYIGCRTCASDSGNFCAGIPAGGMIELGSVQVEIGLGKTDGGQSAGSLMLRSDTPTPALSSPAGLIFSSLARGVEARYDENGYLRQVLAPNALADIVTLDDAAYEIRFYSPDAITGEEDRVYQISEGETPFSVWAIRNPDAPAGQYHRLAVAEDTGGGPVTALYEWDEGNQTWTLNRAGGLRVETRREETAGDTRIVTEEIRDEAGIVAARTVTTYQAHAWGEEIVETVTDPDGDALTTTRTYHTDPETPGSYGKIATQIDPDGAWTRYVYDAQGRLSSRIRPWLDAPPDALPGAARVIEYDYAPVDPGDTGHPDDTYRPRTITEKILGRVVSKTCHVYSVDPERVRTEITEACAHPDAAFGDLGNHRTVRVINPSHTGDAGSGRVRSLTHPDGRMDLFTYTFGEYTASTPETPGVFTPGAGDYRRETVRHAAVDAPEGVPYQSTREETITDRSGNPLVRATAVYTGDGYDRISWTVTRYDAFGRTEEIYHSDGTRRGTTWTCCAKAAETDERGTVTRYAYDALKQLSHRTREGAAADTWPAQADIITSFTYDAAGRTLTQTTTSGGLSRQTLTSYDLSGRTRTVTDAAGRVTRYDYAAGGRNTTETRPGGATRTTGRHRDGRTRETAGTGDIPRYYTYGVNPDGTRWTRVTTAVADGPKWEETTVDLLGRTLRVEKPGPLGIEATENHYNDQGRLVKTAVTGGAATLYAYDALGNQVRTGLDVDGNGVLEPASQDRITDTDTAYVEDGGAWWQKTIQRVYATPDDATPTPVGIQRTQVTGLGAGGVVSRQKAIDPHGNETVTTVMIDPAAKRETRIIDFPDAAIDAETILKNGVAVSSKSKAGIVTTFTHDSLGRRTGATDPRTGTSETHYNAEGRVDWVADAAGHKTGFTYDPATGRKIAETNARGRVTRFAYNDRGQVARTWGDAAYPVKYVYDAYGRMKEMHTYRTGAGFTGEHFPETATGDVTAWQYDEATGLLSEKVFADNHRVAYTYTTGGKLETRTWARTGGGTPLVTTYTYDPDTGELSGIDYSDETPDIGFTYDRLGRQETVTDAVGSRTFTYNSALQLETEAITGLTPATLTRAYETSGVIGRAAGFSFSLDTGYEVAYGYDTAGRFETLGWRIGENTDSAAYAYVVDSDLVASLSTGSGRITSFGYETKRNLKTSVENAYNTALVSRYQYQYDPVGRRTSVTNSGGAFTTTAFNRYDYNSRSELTESKRYQGTDVTNLTTPVDPETRLYAYDPIGNRKNATKGSETTSYAANQLNQYDGITTGGDTASLTYDADGNLTAWDGKVLTYNAENRLTAISPDTPEDGDKKLEFIYDFMGRRVQKTVYAYGSGSWQLEKDVFFVYDGWNVIEEITRVGGSDTNRFFVWGLDISQSLQDAGGIGGLLAMIDDGSTYHYCFDANGNVGQLVNAANGEIAAHYEFDPFGNIVSQSGSMASNNPFRHATQYFDKESELIAYKLRYYSPALGRWLSRDPIGERGGINVYVFAANDPLGSYDLLGLAWVVERSGDNTASAKCNCGDKVEDLAEKIGLDKNDYAQWLKDTDGHGIPPSASKVMSKDRTFSIPNTLIAYWAGALNNFGKGWVYWNDNISYLQNQGFGVVEFNHAVGDALALHRILPSYANKKALHGLYFWGHGYEPDPTTGRSSGLVSHEGSDSLLNYSSFSISYRMAVGLMFACYTNHGKSALSSNTPGHIWFGTDGVLNPVTPFRGKFKVRNYVPTNAHSTR